MHRRVGEWLSGRGFFVQGWEDAVSGPEALTELLREGEPASAVVLGFPLGGGRGLELIRALASLSPRPAVLVFCPHGMLESGIAALKEGADDFLLAPFDPEELEIKLDRALEHRRLRAELECVRRTETATRPLHRQLTGESALMRLFETTDATLLGTGERPALVAEELALQQRIGQRRAVDLDHSVVAAG